VGYTGIQAARLSGCTTAALEAWRRAEVVVPGGEQADPSAPYTFRDLVALRMVTSLLDAGLPMRRVRRAVQELVRSGHDLSELSLVSDSESVWACHDDGEILEALRHGQLALFVSVDRFATEVDADVRAFDAERRAFVESLRERAAHPAGGRSPSPGSPAGSA
jgi:DNA-binding transcriptional MerR regulator